MTRKNRLRRLTNRLAIGLCMLIILAWTISLWHSRMVFITQRFLVGGGNGNLYLTWLSQFDDASDWETVGEWYWRGIEIEEPRLEMSGLQNDVSYFLILPFWLLLSIAVVPTAALVWWNRPVRIGHCPRCKYNLTGNTSGVCSECGLAFAVCSECGHTIALPGAPASATTPSGEES